MWAKVDGGQIVETSIARPAAIQVEVDEPVFGEDGVQTGTQRATTWMSGADALSDAEMSSHGWYEVRDDGPRYDPASQVVTGEPQAVFADGEVTVRYPIGDIPTEELRAHATARAKAQLDAVLAETDRAVMDALETGKPVPADIAKRRADARSAHAAAVADIAKRPRKAFTDGA